MKGYILVTFLCAVTLVAGWNKNKAPRYFPFGEERIRKHLPFDEATVGQDEERRKERRPKYLPLDEANNPLQQALIYPGSAPSRPPTARSTLRCPSMSMHGFPPSLRCT